jgi:hypothetical protein
MIIRFRRYPRKSTERPSKREDYTVKIRNKKVEKEGPGNLKRRE